MENGDLVIPFLLAVCGMMILMGYVLCIAIREMSKQIVDMNRMILLAWRSAGGDAAAGRGLIVKAMQPPTPPSKPAKLSGVAVQKPEPKPPLTMKMGSI